MIKHCLPEPAPALANRDASSGKPTVPGFIAAKTGRENVATKAVVAIVGGNDTGVGALAPFLLTLGQ